MSTVEIILQTLDKDTQKELLEALKNKHEKPETVEKATPEEVESIMKRLFPNS